VISSFVSGSSPTISVRLWTRRVILFPTFTWRCKSTRFSAETSERGREIGGFSIRWTIALTLSAWKVV
jgi:hypothetical protein